LYSTQSKTKKSPVQAGNNRLWFTGRYGSSLSGCRSVPFVVFGRCEHRTYRPFFQHQRIEHSNTPMWISKNKPAVSHLLLCSSNLIMASPSHPMLGRAPCLMMSVSSRLLWVAVIMAAPCLPEASAYQPGHFSDLIKFTPADADKRKLLLLAHCSVNNVIAFQGLKWPICMSCCPDDVCDHHSLISSMSASHSAQLLETDRLLRLVFDYGTVCQQILLHATHCHCSVENSKISIGAAISLYFVSVFLHSPCSFFLGHLEQQTH